ncbi:heme lyase CcmF/NrfE family subunit [Aurantivibrio plasticivorans]
MVPELGHFALILALIFSLLIAVFPLYGTYTNNVMLMRSAHSLSIGLIVFVSVSFIALVYSFVQDDFTVEYVANTSNKILPLHYKLTATWGGHEGSLLLWIFCLCIWLFAVSLFARSLPLVIRTRVLSVMALATAGIILFTLLSSNPFLRLLPGPPPDGRDLNPLLQDIGFIIHPPLLYIGYSGLVVPFAFAITALLSGHLDSAWARWSRPWTNVGWAFLTLGMGMGSWWAYYELGWGFWWGWDPTENNVLIPWLTATALVHSLAVTEKRGLFKTWTILLAITTYCLVLFGTFITRSGIVNSVHAFANDPERGAYLLAYIVIIAAGSFLLYALRAPTVASLSRFKPSSRETFMLLNNVLLTVVMATVLLGTLYPMLADYMNWGKVSVGAPYFNFFWVLFTIPLTLLMAISALTQWKQTSPGIFKKYLTPSLLISLIVGGIFPFFYGEKYHLGGALTVAVTVWIFAVSFSALLKQTRNAPSFFAGVKQQPLSFYSMLVAHLGVGLLVLSAGLTSIYSDERNIILLPGQEKPLFGYSWGFDGVREFVKDNYSAQEGTIYVVRDGERVATLNPQKRFYMSGAMVTTEAAIEGNLWRDLYVSLGEAAEPKSAGGWIITVYVKPFIGVLWISMLLIAGGGFMALWDKRYRSRVAGSVKTSSTNTVQGAIG